MCERALDAPSNQDRIDRGLSVVGEHSDRDRGAWCVEAATEDGAVRIDDLHLVASHRTPFDVRDGLCVDPGMARPDRAHMTALEGDAWHRAEMITRTARAPRTTVSCPTSVAPDSRCPA